MERPRSSPSATNTGCGAGPTHNSYEGADDGQEYPGIRPRRQGDPHFRREDHTADARGPCPFYPYSRVTAQGEDILAWLDTAITRREEAARDAARPYGARWVRPVGTDVVRISEDGIWFQALSDEIAEHVVCNDPQSVLRRCAADRKLIYEVRRTAENAKNNPWDRMHGYGPYADAMLAAVKVIAEGYGWTGGER